MIVRPQEERDAFDLCGSQENADRIVFMAVMLFAIIALVIP